MNIDTIKNLPNHDKIPDFYRDVIACWIKTGGGQVGTPKSFKDIRKQIIWGNKFIKNGKKNIIFHNWINSGLIFINDIIDKEGKVSSTFIFQKLNIKTNWISEFSTLKKAIPKHWRSLLTDNNSIYTPVNFLKNKMIWNSQCVDPNYLNNKSFYLSLIDFKNTEPVGVKKWVKHLQFEKKPNMSDVYKFIFYFLQENKFKVFRWKLLQFILPTKTLHKVWKITESSLCNYCQMEEDYEHFFITCKYLSPLWNQVKHFFKQNKFEINITLNYLVFGYKLFDETYYDFNYVLSILAFSIYKAYYMSEQKTKIIDVYDLFVCELQSSLNNYMKKYTSNLIKNFYKTY